jgi:hypothetical protein
VCIGWGHLKGSATRNTGYKLFQSTLLIKVVDVWKYKEVVTFSPHEPEDIWGHWAVPSSNTTFCFFSLVYELQGVQCTREEDSCINTSLKCHVVSGLFGEAQRLSPMWWQKSKMGRMALCRMSLTSDTSGSKSWLQPDLCGPGKITQPLWIWTIPTEACQHVTEGPLDPVICSCRPVTFTVQGYRVF